ncbi:MAG: hypothetical protein COZ56_07260 [Armatimonadetes bacterium CG_4_8_14_3_um_filter_58_9]|nr:MAG: hypothetical protein COZ56_07260 [Armatimonadetes bacterium CG_4_8_14_3_um_filter_58_9]
MTIYLLTAFSKTRPKMNRLITVIRSSVFRKCLMGLTGLGWCGFLLVHLYGNLFFYAGAEAFHDYSEHLVESPFIVPMEIGLLVLLLLHVLLGVAVTLENGKARPQGYAVKNRKGERGIAASTMIYSGIVIGFFLVLHLRHFKFGERGENFYAAMVELFRQPIYAVWYVLAVCVVGLHSSHAFQSAFRSIGFEHPKFGPTLRRVSRLFGWLIAVGFSTFPIWVFVFRGGQP